MMGKANDRMKKHTLAMKNSILRPGEHIHVIHRRRFDKDIRRHFVGTVETCEAGIREAARENLERFAQSDAELRKQLQEEGPEHCRVHGGDLVP